MDLNNLIGQLQILEAALHYQALTTLHPGRIRAATQHVREAIDILNLQHKESTSNA